MAVSQTRNEKKVADNIRKRLLKEFPGMWIRKIHGGPMQAQGILDFIICYEGLFLSLEVKDPNNSRPEGTKLQQKTIAEIQEAGGVAAIVTSSNEAYHVVRKAIKKRKVGR